ncbi:MAG: hypothetical protein JKY54_18910, partial [Flavobacteriales bacterium]|nr:hypothetical protein [Flavobacteriales bacterium]
LLFKERATFSVCFIIDDYVYFSSNLKTAKQIISAINTGRVIANDDGFSRFFSEKFSEQSNFIYYSNLPFGQNGLTQFFSSELNKNIESSEHVFNGFNRFGWQVSANDNNLVYHNISVSYHSGENQLIANNDLWEIQLDTTITRHPQLLKNHRTETEEVFVQDISNQIYLLSSAGNLKWKKQIDGIIIGDVRQIDVYANNKNQMLFNTKNKIYLLDINGNHVKGFPINLPAFATNSLNVFDYQNDHNYRILVGTEGGKVYNFDKEGQLVKGWQFAGATSNISSEIVHYVMANKDYICFHDETGKIHVLDRRGVSRYEVKTNLSLGAIPPALIQGRSIGTTKYIYTDSTGDLLSLQFDGVEKIIKKDSTGSQSTFSLIDYESDGQQNLLIKTASNIEIVGLDLTLRRFFQTNLTTHPHYINYNGVNYFYHLENNEINLLNEYGDSFSEFPQNADYKVAISDMNRDGQTNIVLVSGRSIKAMMLR